MTTVWRNGDLVPVAGAIDADDRGVLLGDGVFETIAVVGGKPLRLARHLARLQTSARVLGMNGTTGLDVILAAIMKVCRDNGVAEGSARITLLRGPGPRGVLPPPDPMPTLIISATPGNVGVGAAVRVMVATCTRRNAHSPLSQIKSTNYGDLILARQEVAAVGADDALLLNTTGHLAEASAANVFVCLDEQWITPPLSDGVLPGVVRGMILARGFAEEQRVPGEILNRAHAAFLTTSLNLRPISHIDGRALPECAVPPALSGINFDDD